MQESQEREKIIILLTDGAANQGIDPIFASEYLADENVKVYTI